MYSCADFRENEKFCEKFKDCHMPLDGYTLKWCSRVKTEDMRTVCGKNWSKIKWSQLNHDEYYAIQTMVKKIIDQENKGILNTKKTVLQKEFEVWRIEKTNALLKNLKSCLKACQNDKGLEELMPDKSCLVECDRAINTLIDT